MMLSPKNKRYVLKIIPFALIWFLFSLIYLLLEKGVIGDSKWYPNSGGPYDFWRKILITSLVAIITGICVGAIEIFYLNKIFANKSFTKKLAIKILIYLAIMIAFLLFNRVLGGIIESKTNLWDRQVWYSTGEFFSSFAFWSIEIYIGVVISISLFYSEVSDMLGQGVFINFLKGKYHTPIEEELIFMFLDMKSSTTIAENLGHIEYFKLLNEYYADLSNAILEYAGNIYQYVGDEVVVSWKVKNGVYDKNFLKCFFTMKKGLENQSEKYLSKFGVVPSFKAGFHCGKVSTGEIGVLKKDIVFTGDVLNTTARIQSLCNTYNVDILISEQLLIKIEPGPEFKSIQLEESELRGRSEKVSLFTIETT